MSPTRYCASTVQSCIMSANVCLPSWCDQRDGENPIKELKSLSVTLFIVLLSQMQRQVGLQTINHSMLYDAIHLNLFVFKSDSFLGYQNSMCGHFFSDLIFLISQFLSLSSVYVFTCYIEHFRWPGTGTKKYWQPWPLHCLVALGLLYIQYVWSWLQRLHIRLPRQPVQGL